MLSFDNKDKIKNVVIFVCDALRYDYMPDIISNMGIKTKMIASSTFTAPTFPSIISGLYPYNHRVFSFFSEPIDKSIPTLINLKGYNTSLWTENSWEGLKERSPLHKIIGSNKHISLKNIKEPFIYIEDEKGGHCPYGWSKDDSIYEEWDCKSFFEDYSNKAISDLKDSYKKGIDRSIKVFKKRLETLVTRGIEERTLVIFTSDHGELLGEYGGLVAHGLVSVPELIYVPLVFINPQLSQNANLADSGVLRHVDLYPTICDILNINTKNIRLDGESVYEKPTLPKYGISYFNSNPKLKNFQKYFSYELKELGLWKENSGFVLRKNISLFKRYTKSLMFTKFKADDFRIIYRNGLHKKHSLSYKIKKDIETMKLLSSKTLTFGNDINIKESKDILNKISI
ncbi:MAG: sulfatase-like hydrolase/transferase [Candidatus Lokiarchaeota archaeon]|nr:sulfatase-like hydrolase/transferase [Candidatus Lokiarchaeota archaeon]